MAQEKSIFEESDVARLIECMKMEREVEEAQARALIARKKLVSAAEADIDGDLEEVIQEILAAAEHETRVMARSLQNRQWMRQMKDKIKAVKPHLLDEAEKMVGGQIIA